MVLVMTEMETVAVFTAWLERDGWAVGPGPDKWVDVYAARGDERLYAEAKGVTKDDGASADILWGQILRRMTELGTAGVRYALVVPESIKSHVLRVPVVVRQRLGVELFLVTESGRVDPLNH
jgi:hypothetical protein